MKKSLVIICCLIFLFSNVSTSSALSRNIPISITVNGHYIYTDSEPFMQNGSILVPLKFVADTLGANVEWNHEEKSVLIITEEKTIQIHINKALTYVDPELERPSVAPIISKSRTMVPLRFIAEKLDCKVEWDESTYTADITKENLEVDAASIVDIGYSKDDVRLLSKIVTVEGGNISLEAKIAIANVVINRKKSSTFPNTIHDVIYQKGRYAQFPPAHKESFKTLEPNKESLLAAKLALNGYNNISNCLYFNNRPFKSKAKDFYKKIQGEYFYL
jgi:hypothetical protein